MSFDFDQFTKNSINKVIEEKTNDHFYSSKNISLLPFWCIKKLMNCNLKICHMKFLSSSQNHKVSAKIFVNHKFYHINFILTIFRLKCVYSKLYRTKVIHSAASCEIIN
jgi:hypothetical protein